jgi:hypothetical protein
VKHHAAPDFWECYRRLPSDVQRAADKAFGLLKENPRHPSLQFKKVASFWSARVGLNHRALAVEVPGGFLWFWIGNHGGYDRIAD